MRCVDRKINGWLFRTPCIVRNIVRNCATYFAVFFLIFVTMFYVPLASAQDPIFLEQYKDWGAYKKGDTCFVISQPRQSKPKNVKRGGIYTFIIHRPKQKIFDEVSILVGYPLKKGSNVIATIGSKKYTFFSVNENAWLDTHIKEKRIINAMKRGREMKVEGTSSRGTRTVDTYSLAGFSAALKHIDKSCKKK